MLRSMLADIRIALVAVLINRVLHCVAGCADARANWDVGVFCDSVGGTCQNRPLGIRIVERLRGKDIGGEGGV
jgi:hypothetical protein